VTRDFQIPGESLVMVKGRAGGPLANLQQLALARDEIQVFPRYYHNDLIVNAGGQTPVNVQAFPIDALITINLYHFDNEVFQACCNESVGGASAFGTTSRAGVIMGRGARFAANNFLIGLNISSPVAGLPYRFWYTYMVAPTPSKIPLGVEAQMIPTVWRAIPYTDDPYGGGVAQPGTVFGTGMAGSVLWDRTLDN
jgi:hypothetical protein